MVFGRKHQDEVSVEDLNGTIPNVDPYTGRHAGGTGFMSKITGHANTNTNTRTGTGSLSGVDPNYSSTGAPGGAMNTTGGNHLGTHQAYDTYDTQDTTGTGVGGTHMPGNTHGVASTGTTGAGMTGHHQVVGHDPVHPEKVYTADPNTGLRDPYPHTTAGASMGDAGVGTGTAHAPGAVGAGTGFANEGPNAVPNVAPTSSLATNSTAYSGGSGKSLTGKIQSAAGTVLHSRTLKAKGEEKQREAEALRMQGVEISEAERLEAEARQRRDRAVAAGAHPDHKHLGGVVPPREQQAY